MATKKKVKPAAKAPAPPKKAAAKKKVARPAGRAASKSSAEKRPTVRATASPREKLAVIRPSGKKDDSFFDLVHEVARQIPRGRVTSYGAIGAALGTRSSARMVGWAMMAAPTSRLPVPAHRVVNSIGLLTGRHHYNPPERMQQLLEKEGVKVKDSKVVDFKNVFWDPSQEL